MSLDRGQTSPQISSNSSSICQSVALEFKEHDFSCVRRASKTDLKIDWHRNKEEEKRTSVVRGTHSHTNHFHDLSCW